MGHILYLRFCSLKTFLPFCSLILVKRERDSKSLLWLIRALQSSPVKIATSKCSWNSCDKEGVSFCWAYDGVIEEQICIRMYTLIDAKSRVREKPQERWLVPDIVIKIPYFICSNPSSKFIIFSFSSHTNKIRNTRKQKPAVLLP